MLDNSIFEAEWDDWERSEGQLLKFDYFLGNQQMVGTTTRPFLITEGTQLQVGNVSQGKSIEVIFDDICYTVIDLLSYIPERRFPYRSGKESLEYVTGGNIEKNFIRSWFTEIKKLN